MAPESGFLSSLTVYLHTQGSGDTSVNVQVLVNRKNGNGPGSHNQIATATRTAIDATTPGWFEFTLGGEQIVQGNEYVLSAVGDSDSLDSDNAVYMVADTNTGTGYNESGFQYGSPNNPWNVSSTTSKYSIYITYTTAGSVSPSVSPSASPSAGPVVVYSASASRSASASISASASPSISPSVSPSISPSASISPSIPPEPILNRNSSVVYRGTINRDLSLSSHKNFIPSWNTAGRPKKLRPGTLGFNIQTESIELWNGSGWLILSMKKI